MSRVLGHLEMSRNLSSNPQQTDCSQCQSINRRIETQSSKSNQQGLPSQKCVCFVNFDANVPIHFDSANWPNIKYVSTNIEL